ncbi:MAG: 50S ribosomal protein L4 [Armatimonadetes bacterium]|nr:50S ribosomal protein L4 [Candidatus Hippobium faecium]
MATVNLLNMAGQPAGEMEINPAVFEIKDINIGLMHQVVIAEEANYRQGTHQTKTKGEVRGGGAKPFRQKGTGRARQGANNNPHMYHGGVVFGPHPRSYEKNTPVKMRRGALKNALSARFADGDIIFIDEIKSDSISTKNFAGFLSAVGAEKKVLVLIEDVNDNVWKSARNIAGTAVRIAPAVSTRDVLNVDKVVMARAAVAKLEEVLA